MVRCTSKISKPKKIDVRSIGGGVGKDYVSTHPHFVNIIPGLWLQQTSTACLHDLAFYWNGNFVIDTNIMFAGWLTHQFPRRTRVQWHFDRPCWGRGRGKAANEHSRIESIRRLDGVGICWGLCFSRPISASSITDSNQIPGNGDFFSIEASLVVIFYRYTMFSSFAWIARKSLASRC